MRNMKKKTIGEEKASSIAWNWVMEALADLKQADTALLDDLLCKVPNGYDSLSTYTRERLALRHLEDLCATTANANMTNPNSTSDYVIMDVEEPAQDVYDRLLHKMGTSGSSAFISLSSKFDIRQFILQKRSCLPKCGLQQLEESIEGGHPSSEFLRGLTRLNREHQEEPGIKLDGIANGIKTQNQKAVSTHLVTEILNKVLQDPHAKPLNSTRKKEKMVQCIDEGATVVHVDNAINSSKWSTVDEITSPSVSENVIEVVDDDPSDDVIVSYKRKRSEFTKELQVGGLHNGELNPAEHNSDYLRVCEPLESSRGSILSSSIQNKATGLAKETPGQDLQGKRIRMDDVGDYDEHVVPKRIKKSVNDGQMEHCKPRFCNNDSIPQEAPPDGFHGKSYVNESRSGSENQAKPEASHGNGENPVKAPSVYSKEDMAIAAMKSSLLSSQMTLNQDSPKPDWTEDNSCIKCNRGHQLLICCVSTCLIAIHESCLGSSASYDDRGNFYCPFCTYAQATTKYCEIKTKFVQAKEKAELAKNCLDKFTNVEHENKKKQPSELPSMGGLSQSRMVENENCFDEIDAHGKQKEIAITKETQQKRVKDHVDGRVFENRDSPELSLLQYGNNLNQREKTTNISKQTSDVSDWQQEHINAPEEPSGTKAVLCGQEHADTGTDNADLQQQPVNTRKGPSPILDVLASSPSLGTETVLTNQERAGLGNKRAGLPQQQDNRPMGPCPPLNASAGVCTDTVLTDKKPAGAGAVNAEERRQLFNLPQRPSPSLDANVEEISGHDNGGGSYEVRRRQNTTRRDSNRQFSSRRKITPWTFEEEKKLKDGVHKYATSDAKWKKILEFGRNVFQESRTAIDLKDKWRNICSKGGSKAR